MAARSSRSCSMRASTAACISLRYTSKPSLPLSLALYMAMSALRSSFSLVMPGSSKAIPMLPAEAEVRAPGGPVDRSDSRMRPARRMMSSWDETSSIRMANSSPPRRAAVSRGRRQLERSAATRFSS